MTNVTSRNQPWGDGDLASPTVTTSDPTAIETNEIRLPRTRRSPLLAVGLRIGFAASLVVFVAIVVLLGRDGYLDDGGGPISLLDAFYYASVTVTTTGYGDITAVSDGARFAAIALMYAAGLTLNMISLFGLILTLGIVVDDAIVVGEHADFRARKLGEHPVVASENAARRMAMRDDEPTPVGLQLDSGMNRLGLEAAELDALLDDPAGFEGLELRHVMSHLACADEPAHPLNAAQRDAFAAMTDRAAFDGVPRSLAATGGVLLGAPWRFEMTRPGVGLYGGMPFAEARPVVRVETPIIQTRDVAAGEIVGYGAAYETRSPRRIATVAAGYADGWLRTSSAGFTAWIGATPLPSAGRVSMDLITLDVTDAPEAVEGAMVELLGERTRIDHVADAAGTIGYEILTSLGARYQRVYTGG